MINPSFFRQITERTREMEEPEDIQEINFNRLSELCVSHIASMFDISNDFSLMVVNTLWNQLRIPDIEKCSRIEQYLKRNLDVIDIGNELDDLNETLHTPILVAIQYQGILQRMQNLNQQLFHALMRPL